MNTLHQGHDKNVLRFVHTMDLIDFDLFQATFRQLNTLPEDFHESINEELLIFLHSLLDRKSQISDENVTLSGVLLVLNNSLF